MEKTNEPSSQSSESIAENAIERHREFLEEHIDCDSGLLDRLLANGALSKKEHTQVKAKSSFYKRNSLLLDYILEKHQSDRLFTALEKEEQIHVVNYLNANAEYKDEFGEQWPLTKEISILNTNETSLVDYLDCSDLLDHLYSEKVINIRQMRAFFSKPKLHGNNEALLEILRKRSVRDYKQTIVCLHRTDQSRIAEILDKGGDLAADDQPMKTTINDLPLELHDIILQKCCLQYELSRMQSADEGNEFLINRLSSVDICWFHRLTKRRFKKNILCHLSEFYEEFRREIIIFRSNRSYMEENVQLKGLISRLRSADCLSDVDRRLLSRQTPFHGTNKMFKKNNNPDLLHVMRSFDEAKRSDFIRCLRKSNQKLIARVAENGGDISLDYCFLATGLYT